MDHDGVVRRGVRRLPLKRLELDELPAHIPTLTQLYETCGTEFELSIDIKDEAALEPLLDVARAFNAETRLWVCHPEITTWRRGELTNCKLVNSVRLKEMRQGPERHAAELAAQEIDAVNLHHSDWTGGLTTLFHRFNRYCIVGRTTRAHPGPDPHGY